MSWVAECGATLGLVVKPVSLFFFKCCFPTRSALCGWGEVELHLDSGITEEAGVKANAGFEVKCQRDCD